MCCVLFGSPKPTIARQSYEFIADWLKGGSKNSVFRVLLFWNRDLHAIESAFLKVFFGHIARYAPSQTFKNTLPIAHKSLFQNY